jgi:hypothetical protein
MRKTELYFLKTVATTIFSSDMGKQGVFRGVTFLRCDLHGIGASGCCRALRVQLGMMSSCVISLDHWVMH